MGFLFQYLEGILKLMPLWNSNMLILGHNSDAIQTMHHSTIARHLDHLNTRLVWYSDTTELSKANKCKTWKLTENKPGLTISSWYISPVDRSSNVQSLIKVLVQHALQLGRKRSVTKSMKSFVWETLRWKKRYKTFNFCTRSKKMKTEYTETNRCHHLKWTQLMAF